MHLRSLCAGAAVVVLAGVSIINPFPGASARAQLFEGDPPRGDGKLADDLVQVMAQADPAMLIPIIIELPERANPADIALARQLPKDERRDYIRGLLQPLADRSQRDLLFWLEAEKAAGNAGEFIRPLWLINVVGVEMKAEAIERLSLRNDVAAVHYDAPIGPEVFPVEPPGPGTGDEGGGGGGGDGNIECGVDLMGAPQVWNDLGITGQGVVVGVIDTGLCITHPDIANQLWLNADEIPGNNIDDDGNGFIDDIRGWSFDNNGSSSNISDTNGHGTHVSGTVAGDGANGTVTGMAPNSQIMTIKFWNSFSGQLSVWNGMQYGVDNGADVLTASLGWPHSQNPNRPMWREVCENAMAAGVVVVYAAGNEGGFTPPPDQVRTPGDVPDMITAGATNCSDVIASFSSRGPVTWQNIPPYNDWPFPPGKLKPTVSAPGVDTVSLNNNCSGYRTLSGTSMATPHIAGAIALILEANPALDHWEVKQILKDTAIDLGASGPDNTYGAGRVDAYEAVVAALGAGSSVAEIVDVDFLRGTHISGGIAELVDSDDATVVGRSQFGFSANDANLLDMVVGAETNVSSPSTIDLTVEARLNQSGGTVRLRLRNWSTNQFQTVHQYALGGTETVEIVPDVSAADRVRATDGRVDFSFRASTVVTFSALGFRSFVDLVELVVE
jgi:serine protease AprX